MDLDLTPFVNAGIPGALLLWFMFRLERHLRRSNLAMNLMAQAIFRWLERTDPQEAKRLSQEMDRINGGERTLNT